MGQLKANNKNVVHDSDGNIVVINTCGFIENAKQNVFDMVWRVDLFGAQSRFNIPLSTPEWPREGEPDTSHVCAPPAIQTARSSTQ